MLGLGMEIEERRWIVRCQNAQEWNEKIYRCDGVEVAGRPVVLCCGDGREGEAERKEMSGGMKLWLWMNSPAHEEGKGSRCRRRCRRGVGVGGGRREE